MLHDRAEHRRLQVLPLDIALGDGDEVAAEEDAGDAGNGEQPLGQRRGSGLGGIAEFGGIRRRGRCGRAGT